MDTNGDCKECIYSLEKGCLICHYSDPTKCMICASGFFMNKDGECGVYSDSVDSLVESSYEMVLGGSILMVLLGLLMVKDEVS